jgi:hypothetical protein
MIYEYSLQELLLDLDLTWMTEQQKQNYQIVAHLLGQVYYQVNWSKIGSNKIATDIFEHRIKNSAHKPTITTFINKLCAQLSIQAIHNQPELILEAEKYHIELLKIIRTESQLCVMLARRYVQFKRKQQNNKTTNINTFED